MKEKNGLKSWHFYLLGFFMGWAMFAKRIVAAHPDFIEEYGWIAYQPFTVYVIICAYAIGNLSDLTKKAVEQKYDRLDEILLCVFWGVKVIIISVSVAIFYMYVLGGKPNLLICL